MEYVVNVSRRGVLAHNIHNYEICLKTYVEWHVVFRHVRLIIRWKLLDIRSSFTEGIAKFDTVTKQQSESNSRYI